VGRIFAGARNPEQTESQEQDDVRHKSINIILCKKNNVIVLLTQTGGDADSFPAEQSCLLEKNAVIIAKDTT
jgi:hypothetical protein